MNWETAKSWLLTVFLVLDLVLGWQLLEARLQARDFSESYSDQLANTKTLLANHGWTLAASLPQNQPSLSSFQADFDTPPLGKAWRVVFPASKQASVDIDSGQVATKEGHLRLIGKGNWQVVYNKPQAYTSSDDLLKFAWDAKLYTEDTLSTVTGNETYVQTYKNMPIFDASIVFDSNSGTIDSYLQTEIDQIQPTSPPKPVISALDALTSLANTVDKPTANIDNKILKIDLGYARKITVTPVDEAPSETNYWFPVWRVYTPEQTYYINAFTGEVETES